MSDKETVSTTHSGLAPDTRYIARIRTFDKLGNPSGWAEAVSFQTPALDGDAYMPEDNGPPAAPWGLSAEVSFKSVSISWNPNTEEDMIYGYGYYVVEVSGVSPLSFVETFETNDSNYNYFKGSLEPGDQLSIRVKAVDAYNNESPWSSSILVTLVAVDTSDMEPALVLYPGQTIESSNYFRHDPEEPATPGHEQSAYGEGLQIRADGTADFFGVNLEGDIIARSFSTSRDTEVEPGVFIISSDPGSSSGSVEYNEIHFKHPNFNDTSAIASWSRVEAEGTSVETTGIRVRGPQKVPDPRAAEISLYRNDAKNYSVIDINSPHDASNLGQLNIQGDTIQIRTNDSTKDNHILANGIPIVAPPMRILQGTGLTVQNIPTADYTTVQLNALTSVYSSLWYDFPHLSIPLIERDTVGHLLRPISLVAGWYELSATVTYGAGTTFGVLGYRLTTSTTEMPLASTTAPAGLGFTLNGSRLIYFNGTTGVYLRVAVVPTGSNINVNEISLRWISN